MSSMTIQATWPVALTRTGAPGAGGRRERLRPTRRGRLAMTLLVLLMGVAVAVLLTGGVPAAAGTPVTDRGTVSAHRVTVRPGETLWAIAQRTAPRADPRETITEILRLNALDSASLRVGQVLLLPR